MRDARAKERGGRRRPASVWASIVLGGLALLVVLPLPRPARAFGEEGAFNPRPLLTGQARFAGVRSSAPARWAKELMSRTSAPARQNPTPVRADEDALLAEPFAYLSGDGPLDPFTPQEIAHLRRFFAEGGVLFVDDSAPETGVFLRDAKRELGRVLPDASPIPIGTEHVVFRSFYFIRRPYGRVEGPPKLEAIVRGGSAQVIMSSHDVGGALAQSAGGVWQIPVTPNGEEQRERAIRLAVNIAMYVLCSNYKDDQVHAPFLMRRRSVDLPMMARVFALSGDLSRPLCYLTLALALVSLVLLVAEMRTRRGAAFSVALTGLLATVLLATSVLRPVAILSHGSLVGPKVLVLADRSLSMALPGDGGTRDETLKRALSNLTSSAKQARISVLGFGKGAPLPWDPAASSPAPRASHSDLGAALSALAAAPDERPSAIVVLSDGRFERPGADGVESAVRTTMRGLPVPIHTVSLSQSAPPDASIRAVRAAGAAVAHQPLPLSIDIGCAGGLACDDLTVTARELIEGGPPALLASGTAHLEQGSATVELSVTLERAGSRIVEVAIKSPEGDAIRDNDRRLVTFDVARDRVRVLHVAGRPTYDVRALRTWLKADASVDVVAFFILRTRTDDVNATDDDLALIPFPVHELFSEHLPSFDAVVLQDFNAQPYELLQHLPSLAKYVERGGGLIMVGGPDAFSGGHYAGTRLADVLPVELTEVPGESPFDLAPFTARYTDVARAVPVFRPLRALLGDALPEMPGSNRVGDARPGSFVLWTHPWLKTRTGNPMPLLALGEEGDGRAIALAVDGTHRLAYSALASETAGRAHAALWDGLLGWLMRDPRYEPAQVETDGDCVAGTPLGLRVRPLPGSEGPLVVEVTRLGDRKPLVHREAKQENTSEPIAVDVGALEPGGYSARVRVGNGPATRRDFACERGGDEWADSRPDEARLEAIAAATGGMFVRAKDAGSLPLPPATEIAAERRVTPVLPPWVWTLAAALALGAHWIARRVRGLA